MIRIFQPISLYPGEKVTLDSSASHHLVNVLRVKEEESITIFNGQGGEYRALISVISKKKVEVEIKEFVSRDVESSLSLHLAQGISRGEKMDLTIQKAVELGVKKIIPLFTERSTVKLDAERREKRMQHWRSIVISACEQSGRNHIPEFLPLDTLDHALPTFQQTWRFILSPHEGKSLKHLPIQSNDQLLLLVGPEGGFSKKEMTKVLNQGFIPLNLGPRVLRTETAGLAALTALQCMFGDMG
jgi:16S rRNA (uracil1498-N3)-methyltransferase